MLTRTEILHLFAEKKGKGITNKQLAAEIGLTESTISRYFNFKLKLSEKKEAEVVDYIRNKPEYRWMQVPVD